jgi:DNA-binding NtrC family response regulator
MGFSSIMNPQYAALRALGIPPDITMRPDSSISGRRLTAAASAQALAVIQTDHPIDLLFTDICLGPDVGAGLVHAGLELAQQAVELRPELRVLYTTGYGITDGMKAMFVPGSEFLPKPYDINRLAAKIAALTSR